MPFIRFFIIVFSLLLPMSPGFAAEKTVTLATLDWEPYIGRNLKNQGYVAEIVREAFKRSGYSVDLKFMPWARAVRMARIGRVDGYFPEYYSEDVKSHSIFSAPFKGGPMGFFARKGRNISYTKLQDLKPYSIGVVRGYVNTEAFDKATYLNRQEATDDITNLKKLLKGRIDLMVSDKFVGLYILEKNMPDEKDQVEFMEPPLENKDLFVCFPKNLPGSNKIMTDFNDGLIKIKDDGTLDRIMKRHGF